MSDGAGPIPDPEPGSNWSGYGADGLNKHDIHPLHGVVMAKRKAKRMSQPQPEQNIMKFHTSRVEHTIDSSACLTASNRKQYDQTKSYRPLLYHIRAQCITLGSDSDPIQFATAANTWSTKNAVVKLGAKYRKQLRDNDITMSMLPKYGRELRLALETAVRYDHGSGADGYGPATLDDDDADGLALYPRDVEGASLFNSYANTDGTTATFYNSNRLTTISVPATTVDGEAKTVVPCLLGTTDFANNDLAVITEYLGSRRNAHDHEELNHDLPHDDNILNRIGSASQEHFDDIVDSLEDGNVLRPYDEAGANKLVVQGALMAAGDYCSFVAPLGLVSVRSNNDAKFLFTVTAITEM